MPNYCSNFVDITHDDARKVFELASIFETENPFECIAPEPNWEQIPRGANNVYPEREYFKTSDGKKHFILRWPDTREQDLRWNQWRNKNWGCKSEPWDVVVDHQVANNMLHLEFITAWSPSDGIFQKLVDLGYEIMNWAYEEPNMDMYGDLTMDLDYQPKVVELQ